MFTKLRNSYHNASVWAHHHTAVLVFGLTVLAAAFGWQFGSYFMGDSKTHASYDPIVWTARCDANQGNYVIDLSECYALANIYAQLDGPDWNITFRPPDVAWFSNTDIENRYGVNILNNHVDQLSLYGFGNTDVGLGQTVSFAGLPFLTRLWLWSTAINGVDISANTGLKNLTVRYNPNMTSIDVTTNTSLEVFDIEGNNVTSVDMSTLANLKEAYLSYNQISAVDLSGNPLLEQFNLAMYNNALVTAIDFSDSPNLKSVYVAGQNLSSIDLSNATQLQSLYASWNNNLSSLSLAPTAPLTQLGLSNAQLTTLDVSMYPDITDLRVDGNRLTSLTVGTKTQLTTLDASRNKLTSIDLSGLSNPTGLYYLYLQDNFIADLGSGFNQFTNIGFMSMAGEFHNAMNGNCLDPQTLSPSYIAFLDSKFANWASNQTCGRDVPESEYDALVDLYNATDGDNWIRNDGWLSDFSVCDWQHVSCTQVNGQRHVRDLWLNNNNLQGSIPSTFSDLTRLEIASFDNWVNDRGIPEDPNAVDVHLSVFAGMNYLKNIGLFYGQGEITGTLNDLGLLPALEHIRLDGTKISGTIPSFFSQMTNLKTLDFEESNLTGPIPDLTNLVRLEVLDLRNTNVSGPLPEFATQYPAGDTPMNMVMESPLVQINLNGTMLDGELPASWGQLPNLQQIAVGGKGGTSRYIYGELPASWGNLSNLTDLQIMFTNIDGELPASWGNLVNLERLNIIFNRFSGEIPSSWNTLAPQNLLIMGNHFQGPIPSWVTNAQNYLIQNNCFDIENLDPVLEDALIASESRGHMWRVQNNCLSNVEVTKTLSKANPLPGETFTLTIGYKNFGPQKAPRFTVSEVIDEDVEILSSLPPETEAIVNKQYGVQGDVCYDDMIAEGTGPYGQYILDFLAMILLQTDGGEGQGGGLPEGLTNKELFDMLFASVMLGIEDPSQIDMEQIDQSISYVRDLWDEPTLGTPGVMGAVICDFIQNMGANIQNPVALERIYDNIGQVCMPLLGFDYREHADTCGLGGEAGYKRDLGDLSPEQEDEIVLTLRLKPQLAAGSQHDAITYLVLDGENVGQNTIPVTITAGSQSPVNPPVNPGPGPTTGNPTSPLVVDDCSDYTPPIDKSSSYYDAECEAELEKKEEHKAADEVPFDKKKFLPSLEDIQKEVAKLPKGVSVDLEQIEAYLMAKNIGMTTMSDFMAFQPGVEITRAAAAKYFVEYREKVLGEKADESRRAMCSRFDDIDGLKGQDLYEFVIRACMHKLMGLEQGVSILKSFRPYDNLPRAEGATMVSRLLHGTEYDNTNNQYATRYEGHITKLLADKIISDPNPDLIEKRVYPLLMFLRWIKAE